MLMDELLAKYRNQMIAPTATGQASSMPQMPRKDYIGAIGKKPKVSRVFDKEKINTAGTLGGAGLASMARLLQTWNNVDATNESEAIKDYEDRLKHAMDLDKSQEMMQHKLDFEGLSPNDAAERGYKGAATDKIRQDMAFDKEKQPLEMKYKQARIDAALRRGATTHGKETTSEIKEEPEGFFQQIWGNVFGGSEDELGKSQKRLNAINQMMQQPGLTQKQLNILAKQFAAEKAIYSNLFSASENQKKRDFRLEFDDKRRQNIFEDAMRKGLGYAKAQQLAQEATFQEKPIEDPSKKKTPQQVLDNRYGKQPQNKSRVDDAMDYLFAQ